MKLSGILAVCIFILYFSTGLKAAKKYCSHLGKVCHLPKDPGPCRGAFNRFYFDKELGQCRQFIYGGCEGNRNNFRTYKECDQTCPSTFPTCLLPKVTGPCKAYFRRYYFNSCTGKCEPFIYGGCQGNKNNFESITTCYKTCPCSQFNTIPHVNLNPTCYLPKERGPCKALVPRYFYNKCTKKCEHFIYGGCLGNKNNFKSYKECDNVCHYPNVRG